MSGQMGDGSSVYVDKFGMTLPAPAAPGSIAAMFIEGACSER